MLIVIICEKFGWTMQEYESQPLQFIELIKHKIMVDNKKLELENKKFK